MVSSLFIMHYGSNEGYAIAKMERIFYETGLILSRGDPNQVHFSFTDLHRGRPNSLPTGFPNIIVFDRKHPTKQALEGLETYVRDKNIRAAIAFDMQPTERTSRYLRHGGVVAIVAYWGAPISGYSPQWKLWLKRLELALSRYKVDGLIFESSALAKLATQGRGVSKDIVDIVPLGVDTEVYHPALSDYAYQAFEVARNQRIVLFSGHVYEGKGIAVIIRAAVELLLTRGRDDVYFLICGDRGNESKAYDALYGETRAARCIRFGGYRDDMPDIYRSSFCGVVPSLVPESFSFSAVEMAASGLPVVASRIGGLTDSVEDGTTGLLFEPGNSIELADTIEYLLDHPEQAANLGKNGRARCKQHFTLEAHRRRLAEAVRRHLKKSENAGVPMLAS